MQLNLGPGRGSIMTNFMRACILGFLLCMAVPTIAKAIWIANSAELIQIDSSTGATPRRLPVASIQQLAGTTDGGAWARTPTKLFYVVPEEQAGVTVDLAALGLADVSLLAVDPYDNSAWIVSAGNMLAHVDATGNLRATARLPQVASALAIGLDQSVWAAGERELWHLSATAELRATFSFGAEWKQQISGLTVDSLTSRAWIVGQDQFVLLAFPSGEVNIVTADAAIRGSALDPKSGNLWLLTDAGLVVYDGSARRV